MLEILTDMIIGIVVGLIAGPVIILGLSILVYFYREHKTGSTTDELLNEHRRDIEGIKKEYRKKHTKYMTEREKLVKLVDKLPKREVP